MSILRVHFFPPYREAKVGVISHNYSLAMSEDSYPLLEMGTLAEPRLIHEQSNSLTYKTLSTCDSVPASAAFSGTTTLGLLVES